MRSDEPRSIEFLFQTLKASRIEPWELLARSKQRLASRVGVSVNDISRVQKVCADLIPKLLPQLPVSEISSHDALLDKLLGGRGLQTRAVTEVYGAAGTGKTSLCCQFALAACAISVRSEPSCFYLTTEFPHQVVRRMHQILPRFPKADLARIGIAEIHSATELAKALSQMLHISSPPLLLVIDSIAAITDGKEKLENFPLRRLAARGTAILVSNQVRRVDLSSDSEDPPELSLDFEAAGFMGDAVLSGSRPALGYSWSRLLDSRLQLLKTYGHEHLDREAKLIFSPWAGPSSLSFTIGEDGISSSSEMSDPKP